MSGSFTQVTHESWFTRLGGSIKGILFGLLLFLVAFPLLFWNEGRAIKTEKSLEEGAASVISINAQSLDKTNESKLVHLSGLATTDDILKDAEFNVASNAIGLSREVLVYQWQEQKESSTEKELGGGTTTTTKYSYTKNWSSVLISSSSFAKPQGHENPQSKRFDNKQWYAQQVTLGDYLLSSPLVQMINGYEKLLLNETNLANFNPSVATSYQGEIFFGNPESPKIGDTRVIYKQIKPQVVSIIAKQVANSFAPYTTSVGRSIELLVLGQTSAEQMFADEISKNTMMTWILRAVGFFMMMMGLSMCLKPLSVLADVVPFIGNLIGMGTGLIAGVLAFCFAIITIAVAWFFYRPILTLSLVAIVAMVIYLLKNKMNKQQQGVSSSGSVSQANPEIVNSQSSSVPPPAPPPSPKV